ELTDKDGLLKIFEDSEKVLQMEKTLSDQCSYLVITIEDESTEASKIVVSGLTLYLDRTLASGSYALENIYTGTGIWENTSTDEDEYDQNGVFEYEPLVVDSEYVQVVTAPRDQDDSTLLRTVTATIGSEQMSAGSDTINLDAPAYINADSYTMLPVRAIAEALGATVSWDEESRSVSIFSGERIISMTIGEKTMYVNGTPVQMNTAPEISNGRTFVPVRDLANALGITNVEWDEETLTVTLN
ncbi:MAG: copper amine oxidase N-terminal domain-containing protein, partial [Clostridiales bacterium]|nr:copper amine oxidase N-terminal domain-containing protein [Clostridiales bacterium]